MEKDLIFIAVNIPHSSSESHRSSSLARSLHASLLLLHRRDHWRHAGVTRFSYVTLVYTGAALWNQGYVPQPCSYYLSCVCLHEHPHSQQRPLDRRRMMQVNIPCLWRVMVLVSIVPASQEQDVFHLGPKKLMGLGSEHFGPRVIIIAQELIDLHQ